MIIKDQNTSISLPACDTAQVVRGPVTVTPSRERQKLFVASKEIENHATTIEDL